MFAADIAIFFLFLNSFEYIGLKFLTIVVYKKILPLVDDFFGTFLLLINFTNACFLGFTNLHTQGDLQKQYRNAGLPALMTPRTDLQLQ